VDPKRAKPLVMINPPPAEMGGTNAIVWGRAKQYHVAEFPGPLSIKTVVRGSAMWGTQEAERLVDPGSYLVLNAGLVKHGARVDAKADDGKTPGDMATERGHKEVAEWLEGKKKTSDQE